MWGWSVKKKYMGGGSAKKMWGVVGERLKYVGVFNVFFPFRPLQDLKWDSPYTMYTI